jgi:hypothetical protein
MTLLRLLLDLNEYNLHLCRLPWAYVEELKLHFVKFNTLNDIA